MKEVIELSLSNSYAKNWGLQDGIREFLQNAIDQSNQVVGNKMTVIYNRNNSTLTISNKESKLTRNTLLLGCSTKKDGDDNIGQFGEGYKLALLILTRLNKKVVIENYAMNERWTAYFDKSKKFGGAEILKIEIDSGHIWTRRPNKNLSIVIHDIAPEDYEEVKKRSLPLRKGYKILTVPEYGEILTDVSEKGNIYVNGLYITTMDNLYYGYNIKPNHIRIGRDRNLVDSYDIKCVTSQMWLNCKRVSLMDDLIKSNAPDVEYISNRSYTKAYEKVSERTLDHFVKEYGSNAIPVTSQSDIDIVKTKYVNAKPIMVTSNQKELITSSSDYKKNISKLEEQKDIPVRKQYELWKKKYGSFYTTNAIYELDKIVDKLISQSDISCEETAI